MKEIYHIQIKFLGETFDFLFEDKPTAEGFANGVMEVILPERRSEIEITATERQVYTKDKLQSELIAIAATLNKN